MVVFVDILDLSETQYRLGVRRDLYHLANVSRSSISSLALPLQYADLSRVPLAA